MARHKKLEPTNSLVEWTRIIQESGEQARSERPHTTGLEERITNARARLAAAETVADACYWQGALDALNAYSKGGEMPEVVGAGVKDS